MPESGGGACARRRSRARSGSVASRLDHPSRASAASAARTATGIVVADGRLNGRPAPSRAARSRSTIRPRSQRVVEVKGRGRARGARRFARGLGRTPAASVAPAKPAPGRSGHSAQRGPARPAERRADVHHGVRPVAGPVRIDRGVGRACIRAGAASAASSPARARPSTRRTFVSTAPDRPPECDRGDRPRRVRADPRQSLQAASRPGRGRRARRGSPAPRAAGSAPGGRSPSPATPGAPRPALRRRARRASGSDPGTGPGLDDPRDLGLLGHHLGDEDRPRVARRAERQCAAVSRRTRRGPRRARRRTGRAASGRAYHRPMPEPDASAPLPSSRHPIRIGAAFWIQRTDWPSLRDAVRAAEDAGADDLWIDDHLLSDEADRDDPKLEGWTTLAALAPPPSGPASACLWRPTRSAPRADGEARDHRRPHQRRAGDPRHRRRLVRGRARRPSGSTSGADSASAWIDWPRPCR